MYFSCPGLYYQWSLGIFRSSSDGPSAGKRDAQQTDLVPCLIPGVPAAEAWQPRAGRTLTRLDQNRYVGKEPISSTQQLRELGVRLKLNALSDVVADKRIVMVDVILLFAALLKADCSAAQRRGATGAKEAFLLKVAWPCFYGIATVDQHQLVAVK